MEPLLAKFEYISDITDNIDYLIESAKKAIDKVKRKELLKEARQLITAYEEYIGRKVFNQI